MESFVEVKEGMFYRGEERYFIVGTNMWHGAYLGMEDLPGNRERLKLELDLMAHYGINNVRVIAAIDESEFEMCAQPSSHKKDGEVLEQYMQGMDLFLSELSMRGMTATIYFSNFWQWSGGMSQHVSWSKGVPIYDPDIEGNHLGGLMDMSAEAYSDEGAKQILKALIRKVVCRTNSINGKPYKEDATILSWELANEPRLGSWENGLGNYAYFKAWCSGMCSYVKSLDPNHLVTTGVEGAWSLLDRDDLFADSHSHPSIDYLTFHLWIKNWGWFDINNPESTYESAMDRAKGYIARQLNVATDMGKPIVLEEFGVERDGGDYRSGSSVRWRDKVYKVIYGALEASLQDGAPVGGSNFWTWGGTCSRREGSFIWRQRDPMIGDPPQEAQGLNSVFHHDHSTLAVVRGHHSQIHKIGALEGVSVEKCAS
jgi:mannan endo-1,4-beta-mannosidase